ncbi:transcriptional repressor [bacterium]|nr:transcriptional repressor [bacterium]
MSATPVLERVRERSYKALMERGLKLTKPRKALIEMLTSRPGWHFQAEELLEALNNEQPGVVSRATIYRTLELLVEAGVLTKTRLNENSFRYELADMQGHHHHLIDTGSGRVANFTGDEELHSMLRRICAEHGFKEHYHVLEVYGEFTDTKQPTEPLGRPRTRVQSQVWAKAEASRRIIAELEKQDKGGPRDED